MFHCGGRGGQAIFEFILHLPLTGCYYKMNLEKPSLLRLYFREGVNKKNGYLTVSLTVRVAPPLAVS